MAVRCGRLLVATAGFLLITLLQNCVNAQAATASSDASPISANATCPARTVNYITHTLPQQCLRTNWTANNGSRTEHHEYNSTITRPENKTEPSTSSESHHPEEIENQQRTTTVTISAENTEVSVPHESPQVSSESLAEPDGSSQNSPPDVDSDAESPLDNSKFLSFEEWKRQNLAKSGQSPEDVAGQRALGDNQPRRRPIAMNQALDSIGDDVEIELDFGGFREAPSEDTNIPPSNSIGDEKEASPETEQSPPTERPRRKEAGRTSKERFNYASFDCAATVVKSNRECKGASSVLVENKDTYLLNECSADNKFFIVELCDEIYIDTIVLANFEFFSSIFRTFRVSVSDRYPVKAEKWRELGTFEARNSRDIQAFAVENPLIWARYLRVEFLAHYGNEFYCPVSLLRVHGTTMMEEFRRQEEAVSDDDDVDDELTEEGVLVEQDIQSNHESSTQSESPSSATAEAPPDSSPDPVHEGDGTTPPISDEPTQMPDPNQKDNMTPRSYLALYELEQAVLGSSLQSAVVCDRNEAPLQSPSASSTLIIFNSSSSESIASIDTSSPDLPEDPQPIELDKTEAQVTDMTSTSFTSTSSTVNESGNSVAKNETKQDIKEPQHTAGGGTNTTNAKLSNQTFSETQKSTSTSTQPAYANPTTQESFFKSVHKRLQLLEANATLSLQYIEEQSMMLRDAFAKVGKRQLNKTATFLQNLNETVIAELMGFRQQYDQIWQSTVIELENQREQNHREIIAMSTRLTVLADELVFQKRMVIAQSTVLIICLGLVLFSRGPMSNYLDIPVLQNVVNKSQNTLSFQLDSPPESPSSANSSPWKQRLPGRDMLRSHWRTRSDESSSSKSPIVDLSPPTPTSDENYLDLDVREQSSHSAISEAVADDLPVKSLPLGSQSSPPTPGGSDRVKKHHVGWQDDNLEHPGLLRSSSPLHLKEIDSTVTMDPDSGEAVHELENQRVPAKLEGMELSLDDVDHPTSEYKTSS